MIFGVTTLTVSQRTTFLTLVKFFLMTVHAQLMKLNSHLESNRLVRMVTLQTQALTSLILIIVMTTYTLLFSVICVCKRHFDMC